MADRSYVKALVNDCYTFQLKPETWAAWTKGIAPDGMRQTLRIGHQNYNVKVWQADHLNGHYHIRVDGFDFKVQLQSGLDDLISELGFDKRQGKSAKELRAPMPGQVITIDAAAGDQVEEGTAILTLEAMKMENVVQAPAAGVIKLIHVQKGDTVKKGAILVELE